MSTQKIYDATLKAVRDNFTPGTSKANHLDLGSGWGELITQINEQIEASSYACDYTDQLMQIPGQKVDITDLNTDPLPYEDNFFDIITCTEVFEHIENYRGVIRELYRVSKPGAVAVFSTPNILNAKSRVRFLFFGFWNLFGPLRMDRNNQFDTGGHINPLSYFYLAYSLMEAGFSDVKLTVDKHQNTSWFYYILLFLPMKLFGGIDFQKEEGKTIDDGNREIVTAMNSKDMLLGRTIIVTATKPK